MTGKKRRASGTGARPSEADGQGAIADAPAAPGSGLFGSELRPAEAGVVVIPVPVEATTSYGGGAARGPAAVLRASHQVDLLDRDYGPVHEAGIAMEPESRTIRRADSEAARAAAPVHRAGGPKEGSRSHARACARVDAVGAKTNAWLRARAARHLDEGRLVGVLGGDHSSPFGLIEELSARTEGLGILHVDAHADLREAYEGFTWSHASIMRNVLDRLPGVTRLVQVGIRDFGQGEWDYIQASGGRVRTYFESDLRRALLSGETWDAWARKAVEDLPEAVHVSFDIDGLSPELCPHTGTPVPGGLSWAEACHLLWVLASSGRRVVGFDLCEVAPGPRGDEWDGNVGARLLYKLIGCALHGR